MRATLYATVMIGVLVCGPAAAQTAPAKSMRMVVPYAPGGIADVLGRLVAQRLGALWGQTLVVENRPGSGGHVGAEAVVRGPADGSTLMLGTIAHHAAWTMYANLGYDPPRDLLPVVMIGDGAGVVLVHPSLPVKSVRDLVALAKARPGQINYGSAGHGSALHMAAELFRHLAGVDLTHVVYKGSAPAMIDLLGGRIELMFENVTTALPHIASGRVRALATTGAKRNPNLPELPTVAEAGVAGYESVPWYTVSVVAKTPADVVKRLNADLNTVIRAPELAARWAELGIIPTGGSVEDALRRNQVEAERWGKLIRSAKLRAE